MSAINKAKIEPQKQEGWWALKDLVGSKAGVLRAIDASEIPDHWKAAIKSDIEARCGTEHNALYLDAHYFVALGKAVLHYTLTPETHLV